jgi:tRNA (guanosine-2'-O-)-methyltransferase
MKPLFPHAEPILIEDQAFTAREIIDYLQPKLTERRVERIQRAVSGRTCTVVPVMEGLYDRGNVSAVLRSSEAMGYQVVHNIESSKRFKAAKMTTQGAEKWLDLHRWETTTPCVEHLRERGYRIFAMHPEGSKPIDAFTYDKPTALVFGNEHAGVSDELVMAADARVVIPMDGYSQSYNISVAAAIALSHIRADRIRRLGAQGDLTPDERDILTAHHMRLSLASADAMLLRERSVSRANNKGERLVDSVD